MNSAKMASFRRILEGKYVLRMTSFDVVIEVVNSSAFVNVCKEKSNG
jgi:hypothetical protein